MNRRQFLGAVPAAAAYAALAPVLKDRIGIMCQFAPEEAAARKVLAAAREAGYTRAQIQFPWDRAQPAFLKGLKGWMDAEGIRAEVLSAYVNCAAPDIVIMTTSAHDFDRAVDLAPELGASRLVAWTGGYGEDLMTPDPRNFTREAEDAVCRFFEPRLKKLEANRLTVALETYITLTCPDASALHRVLDRLPKSIGAVMDPPNLTPVARYAVRDRALAEMFQTLAGRIGVVHLKDFRLAKDGTAYDLPGPLAGEMNYRLYLEHCGKLSPEIPIVAEHLSPAQFGDARKKLLALL